MPHLELELREGKLAGLTVGCRFQQMLRIEYYFPTLGTSNLTGPELLFSVLRQQQGYSLYLLYVYVRVLGTMIVNLLDILFLTGSGTDILRTWQQAQPNILID